MTYSPLIWEENSFGQQTQLVRMDYTVEDYEVGTWITVKLDTPVKVNPESNYYFGYAATSSEGNAPFVIDDKDDLDGCWYYMLNYNTWKYEWTWVASTGSFLVSAHITDTPDPDDIKRENVRFDIYRMEASAADDESKWTKLNAQRVGDGLCFKGSDVLGDAQGEGGSRQC